MRPYEIRMVRLRSVTTWAALQNAYSIRKDRPLVWLQRACCWVLRKLKAWHVAPIETTVERHLIDANTFMERIWKSSRALADGFDMKPGRLLIGAEDYCHLMKEVEPSTQPFSFDARYGYADRYMDLKVEVIPWMRGILLLPDGISA